VGAPPPHPQPPTPKSPIPNPHEIKILLKFGKINN